MSIKRGTATAITLLLVLTITVPFALQVVSAHSPKWTIISYPYITVGPNPVGVGQRVLILMWVDGPMPGANIENDIRRSGYTLTITKPDGTNEVMNWQTVADTTSCQFVTYTPAQAGNYTLKFDYAGQTYTWSGAYQNDVFTAASTSTILSVQEEPLPPAKNSYPMPTEYWTRPIEGQNTDWYTISSNWLGEPYITSGAAIGGGTSGNYFARVQPNGIAPNSPHIMWTKPIQDGGVVGGNQTGIPGEMYYTGGSYNTRFSNAIIMNGRLYYDEPYGNSGSGGDYIAVDLRTGAEIWRKNTTGIGVPAFGYLYAFESPNQHGILPNGLLITQASASGQGTVWRGYDPRTGVLTTMNVTNVPSTNTPLAAVPGPNGEMLRYTLTNIGTTANPNWRLMQWNSSRVIGYASGNAVGGWYSGNINASLPSRYDWNVSVALPNGASGWRVDRARLDDMMLLVQGSFGGHPNAPFGTVTMDGANVTAVSLKPQSLGQVLWNKNFPPAPNNVTRSLANWDPERGIFIIADKETAVMYGYSLADGTLLWGPKGPASSYAYFRTFPAIAYGKIYFTGYGGILYAYDVKTGNQVWTYGNGGLGNSTFAGLEISYGNYPLFIDVIADGKIFLGTTEHSPNSPYAKDARYRAINATDGTEVWTLMGWGTGMDTTYDRVADGFFVFLNTYDMQIYSVGKGPSALTVDAPMAAIPQGSSLVIRGTVTDVSAGTKQPAQLARFPNGVPAVSDDSQTAWMEYVYMQKPRPMDAAGVEVILSVVDANGNYREVGKSTSNADGFFSYNWKPDIPGEYVVYASFLGSESYWPSHAVTSFAVDPAPDATTQPTPIPQSVADLYFVPAVAGIIVAIVVVGAVIVLMLRKRQ